MILLVKIAIVESNRRDNSLNLQIKSKLDSVGIESFITNTESNINSNTDIVFVTGGDRGILNYYHKIETESPPVLGVYESESTGFLARLHIGEIESAVMKLKRGRYHIEDVCRLAIKVDGRPVEPVLNDVAIFPSKSAVLMEHVLRIGGQDVWHDQSDGVIVSTPTGSTAYSMSAGGPMILSNSRVFVVVSVNSMDNTRRPLIVPSDTTIEISNIVSRYHSEVILDGGSRLKIKNHLECSLHKYPARLIRFEESSATALIAKKLRLAEDLLNMPPSAKLLLKTLEYEGPLSQKELSLKTMLPERTIRMALSHLLSKGYVKKKTSLRDARQKTYELRY